MPNGLEARLRALFTLLPSATSAVEERALAAALAALPVEARARRPLRTLVLVAAAVVCLLAVSAGALAAAGALHVSLGTRDARVQRAAIEPRLIEPRGAHGIAAVVDGRLWLTSRGLRIEGLPVDSAALSPHALYVAAGIGNSLVVMAPNGTRAWSQPAGGRVVGIAWAPTGLRIAYVVQRAGGGVELRTIEGDGDHDRLLDAAVRPVAPSWRADALAVAYVGAGGHPVVYDLGRRAHHVVGGDRVQDATKLLFAPTGRALAIASAGRLWLSGAGRDARAAGSFGPASIAALAWPQEGVAVALNPPPGRAGERATVQVVRIGEAVRVRKLLVAGRITALASDGRKLVVATRRQRAHTRLLTSEPWQVLLDVAAGTTIGELAVR